MGAEVVLGGIQSFGEKLSFIFCQFFHQFLQCQLLRWELVTRPRLREGNLVPEE